MTVNSVVLLPHSTCVPSSILKHTHIGTLTGKNFILPVMSICVACEVNFLAFCTLFLGQGPSIDQDKVLTKMNEE